MNVIEGTAPTLSVSYSASTNRRTTDCADANGNISPCGSTYTYDVANRIVAAPISGDTIRYSYAPGNKRVWRGSTTVDELTYYSAGGAKLVAYNLSASGSNLRAVSTGYSEYFGGKMWGNAECLFRFLGDSLPGSARGVRAAGRGCESSAAPRLVGG